MIHTLLAWENKRRYRIGKKYSTSVYPQLYLSSCRGDGNRRFSYSFQRYASASSGEHEYRHHDAPKAISTIIGYRLGTTKLRCP